MLVGCDYVVMAVVGVVVMVMVGFDYSHVVEIVEASCDDRGCLFVTMLG